MSFISQKSATEHADDSVKPRINIERRIVTSLVDEFLFQGFALSVDDGDGVENLAVKNSSNRKQILEALGNTDEDQLGVIKLGTGCIGWIKLIYGNDGWDVMSDWHTNLDQYMPKTLALVDKLSS